MTENQRKIYHYLHKSASGTTIGEWQDKKFCFTLPVPLESKENVEIVLKNIDQIDHRKLIVFDGHLPWGGLPKNAKLVDRSSFMISTRKELVRKHGTEEDVGPSGISCPFLDSENKKVHMTIYRYKLLLPKSVSCVLRYDHKSLRPIYTFIEINEKGVTWRTSSY